MIWQDLLLDRWVDELTLQTAAATAFGVPASTIAVIDEAEQLAMISPTVGVILERVRQQRDFPLQLTVILRDEELAQRHAGVDGALRIARLLAARLGATVVFAEGPLAPSVWVRARPTGQLDMVSLDTDDSCAVESFFVVAEYPFPTTQAAGESPGARRSA